MIDVWLFVESWSVEVLRWVIGESLYQVEEIVKDMYALGLPYTPFVRRA